MPAPQLAPPVETAEHPALAGLMAEAQRLAIPLPLAVAYSGGADSSALLRAATRLWPGQVSALHVHHGLQEAADAFERECLAVCAELGIALQVLRVQAHPRPGQSPEDAARSARYRALAEAAAAAGARCVLLGQHADDQAETLLMALGRGSGLPGLAAMPARFERHGVLFVRPLLGVSASALRAWLVHEGHSFVDDPSNADERFARNKLRARLMPALAEVWPHFRETLARSARHAAQAQELLDELAREDALRIGCPPQIRALQGLSVPRQANVLRHWLATQHAARPSEAQLGQLQHQLTACTTRGHRIELRLAGGHVLRQGEVLIYRPAPASP